MSFALITGSSKGIGKSIAFEMAKRKYDVLLIARSEHELKEVADSIMDRYKVKAFYLAIDLTDGNAPTIIKNWCTDNNYNVSVLINNAGYAMWGWFQHLSIKDQLTMMQLNMGSMVELTHQMIPMLKTNGKSYILNVASTAAHQAISGFMIYSATKAFVLSFTRGLRMELRKSNISVSCACPGGVHTNFMERAQMQAMNTIAKRMNMNADVVARYAVNGMFNGRAEITPGFINLVSSKLTYFIPKWLSERVAAAIFEKHL